MQYGKRDDLIKIFLEKNSQINLSAIRDEEGVYTKHIQDSLQAQKIVSFDDGSTVCDIGTGGGFPLLPLAIECPNIHFVGIDARRKKIDAIRDMCHDLVLQNVEVFWSRAEEYKGQFDYITARAVGYVDKLIDRSYHLLNPGGKLILWKQENEEEYQDLLKLCKKRNLKLIKTHKYTLFSGDIERVLYIVEKL